LLTEALSSSIANTHRSPRFSSHSPVKMALKISSANSNRPASLRMVHSPQPAILPLLAPEAHIRITSVRKAAFLVDRPSQEARRERLVCLPMELLLAGSLPARASISLPAPSHHPCPLALLACIIRISHLRDHEALHLQGHEQTKQTSPVNNQRSQKQTAPQDHQSRSTARRPQEPPLRQPPPKSRLRRRPLTRSLTLQLLSPRLIHSLCSVGGKRQQAQEADASFPPFPFLAPRSPRLHHKLKRRPLPQLHNLLSLLNLPCPLLSNKMPPSWRPLPSLRPWPSSMCRAGDRHLPQIP
jgi:hypothetical protein